MSASTVSLSGDEVRTFPALELRADTVDGDPDAPIREITGVAVPYDTWTSVGWFEEKMLKGTFRKSIQEAARRLPLLLWHNNRAFPIGVSRAWDETDPGLVGHWTIDESDDDAQTAARKARDGMFTGLSVGFAEINRDGAKLRVDAETGEQVDYDDWWRLDRPGIVWKEARLLEVSLTPTPAYAGAQVAMVRSAQRRDSTGGRPRRNGELDHWHRKLEGLRRRAR